MDKKCLFLSVKFQNALSLRVFIASRASKYMLKKTIETFRKLIFFWSWPTSFSHFVCWRVYDNFTKKYIFAATIGKNEVAQLQNFLHKIVPLLCCFRSGTTFMWCTCRQLPKNMPDYGQNWKFWQKVQKRGQKSYRRAKCSRSISFCFLVRFEIYVRDI